MLSWVQSGCVFGSSYELAKKDAENAKLLYESELRRSQDLAAANKRMKLQIEDLETGFRAAREKADRLEKEFREVRDDLLKLKIEREQQRHKIKQQLKETQSQLEREKALLDTEAELRLKTQGQPEETRTRAKELLQQLQALMEQIDKN
jgi:hypothetical protein